MKNLLHYLLCVFVCQHTGVTDQQVTLGRSVTLACEFRYNPVIWFVIKPSVPPVMIMRTSGFKEPEYYDKNFHNKFSVGSRSQLIINTVTADDLGTYYCICEQPGWALKISNGMRLDTTDPDEPDEKNPKQDPTLIVMLTLLMVVLFAAVIGLVIMKRKKSKKIPSYVNSQQILDRTTTSNRTNGTAVPQDPLTDHEYLEVLPTSDYEIATY